MAQERWNEVKQKHNASVGTLTSRILDVTLPPDDFTVFRTQAGPVASREAAQSMCSVLVSKGDNCYVVETAMFDGGALANAPKVIADCDTID